MRVLDVGCGAGDVSFLVASIVGPGGAVTGIDRSPDAVRVAASRASSAGLANMSFQVADLTEWSLDQPVDALVGRLVLMYLADPAVALRRLASTVKPGGIVAFQEFDIAAARSEPACPIFESMVERICQAFTRAGADIRMGLRLATVFREAGLTAPQMLLGARVEHGPESKIYEQVSQVTRSLLPVMEQTGIATAEAVAIETLADRLRQEALALDATLVSPAFVGAWTTTPA
jgi:ubiquinone/menaquinone biosynthesis C-methylase UbiE